VTVAITRRAESAREAEMAAWVRAGLTLAEGFPGFLGGGWVRAGADRDEWHMLYRFSGPDTLAHWEDSSQRRWWLSSAQGLVEHTRVERRTGIEGWFDPPAQSNVTELATASPPQRPTPPRWKQAVTIWVCFFPLSLLGNVILRATIPAAPLVVRILVLTLAQTPVMTYLLLPWITRRLSGWLTPPR
jgi:antibiotic biosynthesis monooxygenase (ABM) superfamily enzyme